MTIMLSGILAVLVVCLIAFMVRLAHRQRETIASEARFHGLARLTSDGYWEQDAEYRFTEFEGRLRPLVGTAGIGRRRWEIPSLNMTDADWAVHRQLLESRQPFDVLPRAEDSD